MRDFTHALCYIARGDFWSCNDLSGQILFGLKKSAFCPDHWVISTIESNRIIGLIDGVVRRSDDLGCKAAPKRVVAESSSLPSQRSPIGLEFAGNKAKTFLTAEVLDDR